MPPSTEPSSSDREQRRIQAQTAISDRLPCPCVFRDGRWYYCAAHFHGQHDANEVSK